MKRKTKKTAFPYLLYRRSDKAVAIRKLLLFGILFFMSTILAQAINTEGMYVKLLLTSGRSIEFTLAKKPTVKYTETEVTISYATGSLQYDMADIKSITMGDKNATDIEDIIAKGKQGKIEFGDGIFYLKGFDSRSRVTIYDITGKQVLQATTDDDGTAIISTESLANGTYIIKAKSLTYKFIKR